MPSLLLLVQSNNWKITGLRHTSNSLTNPKKKPDSPRRLASTSLQKHNPTSQHPLQHPKTNPTQRLSNNNTNNNRIKKETKKMSAPLLPTPTLLALAPTPPATVSIQNLTTTLHHAGHDAWNRAHKPQPCLLSATVAFSEPFATASATDRLGADTVHYGSLSKALLARLKEFEAGWTQDGGERSVGDVVGDLWRGLTGKEGIGGGETAERGFLDVGRVRVLRVSVALPKASLLGEGVRLTASAVFDEARQERVEGWARQLEVTRLRVPTLVGVNDNERLAKQFVVATVTVEGFTRVEDVYTDIEAVVVKVSADWVGFEGCACVFADDGVFRRWRSLRLRRLRRWARIWPSGYSLPSGIRTPGRSASGWRSPPRFPWRTVRLSRSGPHWRPSTKRRRQAHPRCRDPKVYFAL